jgi:hypothetical protein
LGCRGDSSGARWRQCGGLIWYVGLQDPTLCSPLN